MTRCNRLIGWQAYRGDQGHWKNSPTPTLNSNPSKEKENTCRAYIHLKHG